MYFGYHTETAISGWGGGSALGSLTLVLKVAQAFLKTVPKRKGCACHAGLPAIPLAF